MQPRQKQSSPDIDVIFDAPQWGKARLGCKPLISDMISLAWASLPARPKGVVPEVTVTLTDDAAIRVLNKDHRGKDKATNVLSFPDWDDLDDIPEGMGAVPVGDIIIAFETVRREAEEQGKPLKAHFAHMITHGFLHLLGYDHIEDDMAEEMEALEVKILKKAGYANPYI